MTNIFTCEEFLLNYTEQENNLTNTENSKENSCRFKIFIQ
jgi:hypothetical protein